MDYSREACANGSPRTIVVNGGNANCCTGERGSPRHRSTSGLAASALGFSAEDVAVGSTGVIGLVLDMAKVERGIAEAAGKLGTDHRQFMDAILTTDLVEQQTSASSAARLLILGVAKGSGMIAPNMATMLGYICDRRRCYRSWIWPVPPSPRPAMRA